jgi:hypothetical protein
MAKISKLEMAIGRAAEKPLVNPLKNARSRPATARERLAAPVEIPKHPKNGQEAPAASPVVVPAHRIDKQAFAAYLPLGYRQRVRMYQARFPVPPSLTEIMVEAFDDFFAKHGVATVGE